MVYQDVVTDWEVSLSRSILEVCSVDLSDEANYSCVATNSVGEESASISLTVFTEGRQGMMRGYLSKSLYHILILCSFISFLSFRCKHLQQH